MIKFLLARSFAKQKGSRFPAPFLLRAGAEGTQRQRHCTNATPIFFPEKENGRRPSKRKAFRLAVSILNGLYASGMEVPARGVAAFEAAIRFASAPIIRCCAAVGGSAALRMRHTPCGCRSAHLVGVRSNFRLPPVPSMRRAQQCRYFARSLPPRKRHSRLTTVRRGCKRSRIAGIHGEAMYTALTLRSACSHSSCKLPMCGVKGQGPLPFSGGSKGGILFGKRIPPLPRVPTALGQNPAPVGQKRKYSLRCINKKRSTNKRKLRITYHEQNENRYDHCLRTA